MRNESGRQLRAGQSRTIAYVMLDAANPFFTDVAKGIEEVARDNGVALYLCDSGGDARREADYLELFLEQRVRGILITPVDLDLSRLEPLRRQGVAVSLVDRAGGPSWCSVGVDDVEGGALAVTHLCEHRHQRIAFVGGPMSTPQVADRLRGRGRRSRQPGGRLTRSSSCTPRASTSPRGAVPASGSSGCRALAVRRRRSVRTICSPSASCSR